MKKHYQPRVSRIPAIAGLLKAAERAAKSVTTAATARALRAARVEELRPFSVGGADPAHPGYGTWARGWAMRVRLGRNSAWLVWYDLLSTWGSSCYDHTEQGLALVEEGSWRVLYYEGQHAGEASFATDFPQVAEEVVDLLAPWREWAAGKDWVGTLGAGWELRLEVPFRRRRRRRQGPSNNHRGPDGPR